ncbi:hypothetical protein Pmani_018881 [Petrolisthes manimaculis]|uniref:Uncharacterized protein n=1 Tax=Petrolisthes manimaculis TaxID=1843537 RepID=A0AAE1PIV7_9EUCA|nr:hypothetical protein Pmani_018881 [Petrolisthes manimaculis]
MVVVVCVGRFSQQYSGFAAAVDHIESGQCSQQLEGYGEVKRRGSHSRGQRHSRSRSRSRGGMADSGEDYETLGSDTETEHGGVSSRTESSNQLDDIPSIRDHTVYARGPGNKDPRDAVYSRDTVKDHREVVYSRDSQPPPPPQQQQQQQQPLPKEAREPVYGSREAQQKDPRDVVFSREGSRDSSGGGGGAAFQQRIHHSKCLNLNSGGHK